MIQPTNTLIRFAGPTQIAGAATGATPPATTLRFGSIMPQACPIPAQDDGKHIDDSIYDLLRTIPKVDLHEHQSGSSDLSFLKYILISLKQEGNLKDISCLDWEEVRRYYRAYIATERGKPFMGEDSPNSLDDETMVITKEDMEQFMEVGLQAYLSTSKKINPYVKNIPAAYLLAHLFALEVASENVRYVEYRVSPSGNAYGGYGNATPEDIIGSVEEGLKDAKSRLERSRKNFDYGLILLMERAARPIVKVPDTLTQKINGIVQQHYEAETDPKTTTRKIISAIRHETKVRINVDQAFSEAVSNRLASGTETGTPQTASNAIIRLLEKQQSDKVATAVDMAKEAVRLRDKFNICGIDLAGAELNNPVSDFRPAFDVIKAHNEKVTEEGHPEKRIGITIHAGETPRSGELEGWESIKEAIDAAWSPNTPVRIGHGIQLINSSPALQTAFQTFVKNPNTMLGGPDTTANRNQLMQSSPLLKEIIEKNIVLEMCPKSNVMTYGVNPFLDGSLDSITVRKTPQHDAESYSAQSYKRHPAVFLSRLGVQTTLSSDNRTISNTDITNEMVKLYKYVGIRYRDLKKMVLDGLNGAFIFDEKTKNEVAADMTKGLQSMEREPKYLIAMYKMANCGDAPHSFKLFMMKLWIHTWTWARNIMDDLTEFINGWIKPRMPDLSNAG